MGGATRRGRWRLAPRCHVVNLMGGADLDLNEVELTSMETEMVVISIMGGADIIVPDGLRVEVSEFSLMGGNDVHLGETRQPSGAPLLRLKMFSLMGGNEVWRNRKLSRAERRIARRERHHGRHLH